MTARSCVQRLLCKGCTSDRSPSAKFAGSCVAVRSFCLTILLCSHIQTQLIRLGFCFRGIAESSVARQYLSIITLAHIPQDLRHGIPLFATQMEPFRPLTEKLPVCLEDVRVKDVPSSAFYISDFISEEEEQILLAKVCAAFRTSAIMR